MSMSRTFRRRAERTRRAACQLPQSWTIPLDPFGATMTITATPVPGSHLWSAEEREAYIQAQRAALVAAGSADLTDAVHAAAVRYGEVAEA